MSSVLQALNELKAEHADAETLAMDNTYIRKSSVLVYDALQKGADILQLPNGDIVITETKTVTYQYQWNAEEGVFEKNTNGKRARKRATVASTDTLIPREKLKTADGHC
jgi:hypothetical protein